MAIPRSCSILIRAAGLIVPRALRTDWLREWHAELWHRAESGAPAADLLRCARGAFRDALWFRSSEYAQAHLASEGFWVKPLRLELTLLALAVLLCAATGIFRGLGGPNESLRRAVRFERGIGFLGALDLVFQKELLEHVKKDPAFEAVAGYHWSPDNLSGLLVSDSFFDVLGLKPLLGRTFGPGEDEHAIVLTEPYWKQVFHGDRQIVGRTITLGGGQYRVIGVVSPDIQFSAIRVRFYGPLEAHPRFAGAIAKLRPGVTVASAQKGLRTLVQRTKLARVAPNITLAPLWIDPRRNDLLTALTIALTGALGGLAFLLFKGLGGARYQLLLGARLFILLLALSGLRMGFFRLIPGSYGPVSFFQFWIFLLVCCAAAFLVVRDHRDRCLVCLRRMLMPAPIGTWSSALLDQPATEYVCPAGHGTLYVGETSNAPVHWTVLDESWQDLFVHR